MNIIFTTKEGKSDTVSVSDKASIYADCKGEKIELGVNSDGKRISLMALNRDAYGAINAAHIMSDIKKSVSVGKDFDLQEYLSTKRYICYNTA